MFILFLLNRLNFKLFHLKAEKGYHFKLQFHIIFRDYNSYIFIGSFKKKMRSKKKSLE